MNWLIGMMGVGKTTAGRAGARRLGQDFYDTDEMIESMSGTSVSQIWRSEGEGRFRELERSVIASVPNSLGVTAVGGGAVIDPDNVKVIAEGSTVVWLQCTLDCLLARVGSDRDRPLLEGTDVRQTLERLEAERQPMYASLATFELDTTLLSTEEVTERLVRLWTG